MPTRKSVTPRTSNKAPQGIRQLTDSVLKGELVAIIGSGVSMGLTNGTNLALSWKGLVLDGFSYGVKKGRITASQAKAWQAQLDSTDLDDLLGAAEFVSRKLDAPKGDLYARWLEAVFKTVEPSNTKLAKALRRLQALGIPFVTLNYDLLLERVTSLPALNLADITKVGEWMRREAQFVFHLHGSFDVASTCILGIRDYQTTHGNEIRDLIQRSLGSFRRLLFIGCGDTFADPNFAALSKWLREKMSTGALVHYALVTELEAQARHADPAWHGFVEPISYGATHDALAGFLLNYFPAPESRSARKRDASKTSTAATRYSNLLQDYRNFLLKDCGQMTIEGVRADMDTAQRRFDLERLFVPLRALPAPPDIPDNDPQREKKLLEWQKKNKEPLPFAKVFETHKRLALLALPGGGKSLLLKRIAVAYADPSRRAASSDQLPDLNLIPVLIRCREWREHIHRPILSLLKNISDVTGQPQLVGLADALAPLFGKGQVLLLVDGLDEIHEDGLRTTFVENLEVFLADNHLTRVVVTSREAGFALVAPTLARFCNRWRVAPLDAGAIKALCSHWHRLMIGESPEIQQEAERLSAQLLRSEPLRRLAENPLLLTMLLVVKHGAGQLPPDRVSLYGRAVEVLLDTWNIKGHAPLNLKEGIPQLAFAALRLQQAGQQTATETQLIGLFEEAREKVPQIRRYAKDDPKSFLRRVELRSSLLVEGGLQADAMGAVPFYQFRHLTFQEYLAAVAVVEGHYVGYNKSDTVLTPLKEHLTSNEWKEVVPMSAVLARKQAEPLLAALVELGNHLRMQEEANEKFEGKVEWLGHSKLPTPIANLVESFIEEAEATQETLTAALQLATFFARGCHSDEDWESLSRGLYGEELLHQAWRLYEPMNWPQETWIRNTFASLAAYRRPMIYWESTQGQEEVMRVLESSITEEIGRGLLTCCGILWNQPFTERGPGQLADKLPLDQVEKHLFCEEPAILEAALWAWGFIRLSRHDLHVPPPTPLVLDRILSVWLNGPRSDIAGFALTTIGRLPRDAWSPKLSDPQLAEIRKRAEESPSTMEGHHSRAASTIVGSYARNLWSEKDLRARLVRLRKTPPTDQDIRGFVDSMLEQISDRRERTSQRRKSTKH